MTEGCFWPFNLIPRGQIYDPQLDIWENIATGLQESWTGSSVVIYGYLFVGFTEHERTKVKLYDAEWESSDVVEGPPYRSKLAGLSVSTVGIGHKFHVAVGHIWRLYPGIMPGKKHLFSVQWQIVDAPGSHYYLRPSSVQIIFA